MGENPQLFSLQFFSSLSALVPFNIRDMRQTLSAGVFAMHNQADALGVPPKGKNSD